MSSLSINLGNRMTGNRFLRKYHFLLLFAICGLFIFWNMSQTNDHSNALKSNQMDTNSRATREAKELNVANEKYNAYKRSMAKSIKVKSEYQFYNNICITEHYLESSRPFLPYMVSYDTTRKNSPNKYHINLKKDVYDSYWIVRNYKTSIPKNVTFKNEIAFFPTYLRDTINIFLLWHNSLPAVYGQMKYAKENLSKLLDVKDGLNATLPESTKLKKTIVATSLRTISKSFQSTFMTLGFDNIIDYGSLVSKRPVCYKYGIIGQSYITDRYIIKARDVVISNWSKNKPSCDQMHVLIIQRNSTRRILDIEFIKESLEVSGLRNVRILQFEGWTLAEQYDIIRCTALLIGKYFCNNIIILHFYVINKFYHNIFDALFYLYVSNDRPIDFIVHCHYFIIHLRTELLKNSISLFHVSIDNILGSTAQRGTLCDQILQL